MATKTAKTTMLKEVQTTAKKTVGGVKRSVLLKEAQDVVDLCYELYGDMTLNELSQMTGLSAITLSYYRNHAVGYGIRFSTIQVMAVAAGLRVTATEYGIKLHVTE